MTDDCTYIIKTHLLTDRQKEAIRELVEVCRRNDGISLSYPLDPEVHGEHYLLMGSEQTAPQPIILGVLGLVFYGDDTAECSAFIHPEYRRRGYFSKLFDLALDSCKEADILFPVSECCRDTMAALEALGAELEYKEHQMELCLTPETVRKYSPPAALIIEPAAALDEDTVWRLMQSAKPGAPTVGTCRTLPVSDECVCLHHVEILPHFRGLGYGTSMLSLLLPRLFREGIRKVLLQVTDDNAPAMALYKKTGFRITETLSYYLL